MLDSDLIFSGSELSELLVLTRLMPRQRRSLRLEARVCDIVQRGHSRSKLVTTIKMTGFLDFVHRLVF
jgi:hypothetical protein